MDEGDGDAGGVEAGEVEPDQEVPARVHLDGADLGWRISTLSTLVYSSLDMYLIVHLSVTLAAILFKLPRAKSSTSVIWN